MKGIYFILITWGLVISLAACKKHSGKDDGHASNVNVYILGKVGDSLMYWKNGEPHFLYKQSRFIYGIGTPSIFASGNNVYVIGNKIRNTTTNSSLPVYWRNDETVVLPDSTGDAVVNTLFVSNNDVYVAGTCRFINDTSHVPYTTPTVLYPKSGNVATLWKNGLPQTLSGGQCGIGLLNNGNAVNTYADYVSAMHVTGNDVYVAGGSHYIEYTAMYWKNGVRNDLLKGLIYKASNGRFCYPITTGIFASNNDVYVSGYQVTATGSTAIFWKNGEATFLTPDSISGSEARGIYVTKNDIHIAGYQNIDNYSHAMYWKNGLPTILASEKKSSVANAIFVWGNDVYIAGYSWTVPDNYIATWWKNGVEFKLTDGNTPATANSIYIQ